jgi:WD40 repeat protein
MRIHETEPPQVVRMVQAAHRARSSFGVQAPSRCQGSITALHFMRHSQLLATASDASGLVKLWDVRMLDDPVADLPETLMPGEQPPHLNAVPTNCCLDACASKGVVCISEDPDGVAPARAACGALHSWLSCGLLQLLGAYDLALRCHARGNAKRRMISGFEGDAWVARVFARDVPARFEIVNCLLSTFVRDHNKLWVITSWHAGLWTLVMRRGGWGVQLYDSLRVDCTLPAVRSFHISEHVSFFSSASFSGDGRYIAATGSHGGTYIFEVRARWRLVCTPRSTAVYLGNSSIAACKCCLVHTRCSGLFCMLRSSQESCAAHKQRKNKPAEAWVPGSVVLDYGEDFMRCR